MSRRSLLTPKLQTQLCELLAKGVPIGTACEASGIAPRTVRDWLQRAEIEKGLSAFAAAISRARARGRVTLVRRIIAADDWRADAWLLARLAPDEFGTAAAEESKLQQSGPDGEPVPTVSGVTHVHIHTGANPEEEEGEPLPPYRIHRLADKAKQDA